MESNQPVVAELVPCWSIFRADRSGGDGTFTALDHVRGNDQAGNSDDQIGGNSTVKAVNQLGANERTW
jgi:hypothetical protein